LPQRQHIVATKVGIDWTQGKIDATPRANAFSRSSRIAASSPNRLHRYLPGALPDPLVSIEETAGTLRELYEQGKIALSV